MFLIIVLTGIKTYSKYLKEYELNVLNVITDNEPPTYNIEYSKSEMTNEDVEILLIFSEEIDGVIGFKKIDNLRYSKILKENEQNNIEVSDLAGNKCIVNYNVNWIDKDPPIITGIENNKTYNGIQKAEYFDNLSGIKNIEKIFYHNSDSVASDYDDEEDLNTFSKSGYYEIKVQDNAGNETLYNIEIE